VDTGYDAAAAEQWAREDAEFASPRTSSDDAHPLEEQPASDEKPTTRISWPRGSEVTAVLGDVVPTPAAYDHDPLSGSHDGFAFDEEFEEEEENPDEVDTTSIPVLSHTDFSDAGSSASDFVEAEDAAYAEEVFAEDVASEPEFPEAAGASGVPSGFGRHAAME